MKHAQTIAFAAAVVVGIVTLVLML